VNLLSTEEVEQARVNVRRYPWAGEIADRAVAAAQPFVERSDDALWRLVTGQQIPRGIHVNPKLGCPSCGRKVYEEHGNYPWILDIDKPFKIQCPSCDEVWPKNDFSACHRRICIPVIGSTPTKDWYCSIASVTSIPPWTCGRIRIWSCTTRMVVPARADYRAASGRPLLPKACHVSPMCCWITSMAMTISSTSSVQRWHRRHRGRL